MSKEMLCPVGVLSLRTSTPPQPRPFTGRNRVCCFIPGVETPGYMPLSLSDNSYWNS